MSNSVGAVEAALGEQHSGRFLQGLVARPLVRWSPGGQPRVRSPAAQQRNWADHGRPPRGPPVPPRSPRRGHDVDADTAVGQQVPGSSVAMLPLAPGRTGSRRVLDRESSRVGFPGGDLPAQAQAGDTAGVVGDAPSGRAPTSRTHRNPSSVTRPGVRVPMVSAMAIRSAPRSPSTSTTSSTPSGWGGTVERAVGGRDDPRRPRPQVGVAGDVGDLRRPRRCCARRWRGCARRPTPRTPAGRSAAMARCAPLGTGYQCGNSMSG